MRNKKCKDYKVNIWGATFSKNEANKIGLALIFSFIVSALIAVYFGLENKILVFLISMALAAMGYFGIAGKVFPNK